jgi:3-oxoacyl-[acyl-carrier protein] reductase
MGDVLTGRVALVTGGSRGIGQAIAVALAGAGADIALSYRQREDLAGEVVALIERTGRRAIAIQADVSRRADVRRMVATARDSFGHLDILVNNAGLLQQKPFDEITDEDFDAIVAVNLRGTFACVQEAAGALRERGDGRIINLASSGGQLGGPLAVHYSASKAGVISLTRSFARVLAPEIAVNCISPGLIETEMSTRELASPEGRAKLSQIPSRRPGTPEEIGQAAVFLASSTSYVTGQTLNVNGGLYLG